MKVAVIIWVVDIHGSGEQILIHPLVDGVLTEYVRGVHTDRQQRQHEENGKMSHCLYYLS